MSDMGWTITACDGAQGMAANKAGASFNLSRGGSISVRDTASEFYGDGKTPIGCLREAALNVPRKSHAIR